jgi:ribonuclease HI
MCELTAIFLALSWIQDFKPLNTVIFVDSLSALQAIKGSIYKVKNYIIYDIYSIFTSLSNIGIIVILEWIPSHVGILGNELADKEAKNSLSLKNYIRTFDCL